MNPSGNGEISNEFFKKLNQQIVQKDNLIKLLQLQIRNLKTQIESGGSGAEETAELKKALDEKTQEVEMLVSEQEEQKVQFDEFTRKKDEEIEALNKLLEESQPSGESAEVVDDPRVPELESLVTSLREELQTERAAREELEETAALAVESSPDSGVDAELLQQLRIENEAAKVELGEANSELEKIVAAKTAAEDQLEELKQQLEQSQLTETDSESEKEELRAKSLELEKIVASKTAVENQLEELQQQIEQGRLAESASESEKEELRTKALELEQDVSSLRQLLAEKDEAIAAAASSDGSALDNEQLSQAQSTIEQLQQELAKAQESSSMHQELEEEVNRLRADSSKLVELEETISKLQAEVDASAEMAAKLGAIEAEREQLAEALESAVADSGSKVSEEEVQSLKLEIASLKESLSGRDEEISRLRVVIDSGDDESMVDPAVREEVEQLTSQVADQLLAIQKFEGMVADAHTTLEQKEAEIDKLKSKLERTSGAVIPVDGSIDILTSFFDFFDGLDSIISKNPLPELQSLHKKLLDRLIVPNKITYMPALAEEFNNDLHIATDYFRSYDFPEKCVVFEVEKGYLKGDDVVKKSKVWVVQNLYNCPECNATQGNSDSKFCHLCGARIMAPNGLPVDSLPEFEPTSTTYQRFAERMFEKGNQDKAKEYLQAGLAIDDSSVPLMVRYADVLVGESKFEEAMKLLTRASKLKEDHKIEEKIQGLEAKLSIFKQAQNLKLAPEEFEKLLNLIQKQP